MVVMESKPYNLENDLKSAQWVIEKVKEQDRYAQNLYAALCNNSFCKNDVWPIIAEQYWSCSWRYAGGIIAEMREEGDYLDWYCSGIGDNDRGYVGEGDVTDEISKDLFKLGWIIINDDSEI